MGIFTRFTLRSLSRNRTRTVVSIVGIVLSTALITAIFTTVTSLEEVFLARTIETEGSWQLFDPDAEEGFDEKLLDSPSAALVMTSQDLGDALIWTDEDAGVASWPLINVRTLPRVLKGSEEEALALSVMPEVVEGRLPSAAGEICLPHSLRGDVLAGGEAGGVPAASSDGAIQLGSTITLPLGRRVGEDGRQRFSTVDEAFGPTDGYGMAETLEGAQERTFTVVGFYEGQYYGVDEFAGSKVSYVGLTADTGETGVATCAWVSTTGFASRAQLIEFADGVFDVQGYYLHSDLVSYQGMFGSNSIWVVLWRFAAILTAVIAIAAVSLIYNSFAISVAERTRQFGLLSSLGASRRQLRRTIYVEALALAAVGIPVGVALGILGVRVVLGSISSMILEFLSLGDAGALTASVRPLPIAIVCLLSLVVVFVSAAVPAVRASRVSAVDAIRQARDVRLDRRTERRLARASAKGVSLAEPRGLLARAMGLPGLLAERNARRAGSKGRVVVVSLALSVALIVIAGSIRVVLAPLVELTGDAMGGASTADLVFVIYNNEPVNGAQLEVSQELADSAASAERALAGIDGIGLQGTVLMGSTEVMLPAGTVDSAALRGSMYFEDDPAWGIHDDGSYNGVAITYYIPDELWEELSGRSVDADGLQALLLDSFVSMTPDDKYVIVSPYAHPTTVDAYSFQPREGYSGGTILLGDDGKPVYRYERYDEATGILEDAVDVPVEEAASAHATIEVVGTVSDQPELLASDSATTSFPVLLMPKSQVGSMAAAPALRSFSCLELDGSRRYSEVEEDVYRVTDGIGLPERFGHYAINYAGQAAAQRSIYEIINLFVFLFSFITMLIAVANVFNTLYNSIILRTREFAVLQSCGMDGRAFTRMLVCECAGYALRALLLGLGLGLAVAFLLGRVFEISFTTGILLPVHWGYVLAAVGGVVFVLAISVMYALRRSHALNVVEALRADAI